VSEPQAPGNHRGRTAYLILLVLAVAAGGLGVYLLAGGPPDGPGGRRPPGGSSGREPGPADRPAGGPGGLSGTSGALPPEIRAAVDRFKDVSIPVAQRQKELGDLARKADDQSVKTLMALGDEPTYLNWAAVEALGSLAAEARWPAVLEYLRGKCADPDARVLCAALRSLARQAREEAVPDIAAAMERNRIRPDGHEQMVLNAAVEALSSTGSPRIAPHLLAELGRSEEKGWSPEYGSLLVAALRPYGTDEVRAAIRAYADRLAARVPKDAMAGEYLRKKIAEARAAADGR
jgi:hypothetical protein